MPRAKFQDRLDAGGDRLGHHLEVSVLRAQGRELGGRVLLGGHGQQLPAGRHGHQDDPHRHQHAQHDRLEGYFGRARPEQLPRPGEDPALGAGRAEFHAVRFAADRWRVWRTHVPVHRDAQSQRHGRARGVDVEDQRGPAFLLSAARHRGRRRREHDRERLLQVRSQGIADGVRRRGAEPVGREPGRCRGMSLLKIENLSATVGGKKVLNGLSLTLNAGEVHAIMGPNGSGKSTLSYVLAGRPGYEITGGSVQFEGRDLTTLAPEERARAGLFLGFQYPVEIPGVNNVYLLKAAVNARRKALGLTEVDAYEFLQLVRGKMKLMHMDESFLGRGVNEGFSGGEKKRNEILQMLVIEPRLAVLDETDSGLDIDALKVVARGVNSLRSAERAVLLITHYQRLLEHVVPDFVHVLARGRIAKSGDRSLALELERRGYDWVLEVA